MVHTATNVTLTKHRYEMDFLWKTSPTSRQPGTGGRGTKYFRLLFGGFAGFAGFQIVPRFATYVYYNCVTGEVSYVVGVAVTVARNGLDGHT